MAGWDARRAWWQQPPPYLWLALWTPAFPGWWAVAYIWTIAALMFWASTVSKPRFPDIYEK